MTETEPQPEAEIGAVAELAPEAGIIPPSETDPILPPAPRVSQPPTADHIRLAEALVFASPEPVHARHLAALLPEDVDAVEVLRATQARFAGSGVELAEIAGGWQFRTAPDLAPRLTRVISRPRRLPRVAMETLAIIAWHQPVTRAQIEEIRGATLSQNTLDALLEAGIIRTAGHREVPGRPALWATTPQFLVQFGLKDLKELPKREELVNEQAAVLDGTLPPEAAATLSLPLADEAPVEESGPEESVPDESVGGGAEPREDRSSAPMSPPEHPDPPASIEE
jgi:segregation and condensation protein B